MTGPTGSIHTHFARGASAAALTFNPTADSEIQPYYGAGEALMLQQNAAVSALAIAVGAKTTYGVQVVQEPSYIFGQTVAVADAPYPVTNANAAAAAVVTGIGPNYVDAFDVGKVVPRDADMVVYLDGPGTDDGDVLIHMLYGPPLYCDQLPGKRFARFLEDATDAGTDSWEELEQSPINTFDPQKLYALIGLGAVIEDQPAEAVRVTCPSFNGLVPKGLAAQGMILTKVHHPYNGRRMAFGIFSGAESLTVEVFNGGAAQKPGAILEFIELDNPYAVNQTGNVQIAPSVGRSNLGGISSSGSFGAASVLGLLGGLAR